MNYGGNRWFWGDNAPDDTFGANGDVYFDALAGDFYYKATGTWGSPFYTIGGGSTVVAGTYEADFGSTPVYSATFTVTATGVTTSMDITANLKYSAPTGKDLDELEFAEFEIMADPGTDQFTLYLNSTNGPVADKFKISWVAA